MFPHGEGKKYFLFCLYVEDDEKRPHKFGGTKCAGVASYKNDKVLSPLKKLLYHSRLSSRAARIGTSRLLTLAIFWSLLKNSKKTRKTKKCRRQTAWKENTTRNKMIQQVSKKDEQRRPRELMWDCIYTCFVPPFFWSVLNVEICVRNSPQTAKKFFNCPSLLKKKNLLINV